MINILIAITLLGLLDSLNPATIIAMVFLLSTANPSPRTISFLLGVGITYFVCGLLVHFGLSSVFDYVQTFLASTWGYVSRAVLGVGLVGASLWLYYKKSESSTKTPTAIHPLATFFFGVTSTISDMPTAFPYLVALERISTINPDFITTFILLLYYNILYALPALILLFSYLIAKKHATTIIDNIKTFFQRWMKSVTISALSIFGVLLVVDSGTFFVSGNGLL
ncbi:MAG: GAP family protein [Trueperaceae bacterium]